ncbi:hypothetical protein LF817_13090 [Halobacillus sp. A1]|uniref:hypothetical protein n=1 Tax=Halobacillus sp. A1 TaxID=2880262 RepID=UPI0020A6C3EC|nr:hypothetical protein [Halobacillus sp. A1]MCP3032276.1 hypothetical protein [Halobacillus sp. A1]
MKRKSLLLLSVLLIGIAGCGTQDQDPPVDSDTNEEVDNDGTATNEEEDKDETTTNEEENDEITNEEADEEGTAEPKHVDMMANDERIISMLKESGFISEDATPEEIEQALNEYVKEKAEGHDFNEKDSKAYLEELKKEIEQDINSES